MDLLDRINTILEKYDDLESEIAQLDEICEKIPDEQSNIDKLLSDYYHIIENEKLSDKNMINICKKIHDARVIRRSYDMKNTIIGAYKRNKQKLMISPKGNRKMFENSIQQAIKDFPTNYNFRILTDDEVQNITGNEYNPEYLIQDLKSGEYTKKELAEKYHVSQSLVYYYSRKIEK